MRRFQNDMSLLPSRTFVVRTVCRITILKIFFVCGCFLSVVLSLVYSLIQGDDQKWLQDFKMRKRVLLFPQDSTLKQSQIWHELTQLSYRLYRLYNLYDLLSAFEFMGLEFKGPFTGFLVHLLDLIHQVDHCHGFWDFERMGLSSTAPLHHSDARGSQAQLGLNAEDILDIHRTSASLNGETQQNTPPPRPRCLWV